MIPISQTGQLWIADHQGERDRRRAEARLGELVARWTRRRRPSTRQARAPEWTPPAQPPSATPPRHLAARSSATRRHAGTASPSGYDAGFII
ncbi:hypothetical protein [Amycolatopsis sp. cmx-4-68]|uniref:hypothetical protein n=1 Tax=Amycolatopsis sp. cmx-4-68 TaxID=2790938 RepID=UPI003979220F